MKKIPKQAYTTEFKELAVKRVKVLQRAGLITQGRQAQWRPCRLEAQPLRDVADWVEQYRRFWDERLDRLEDYLRELQAQEPANDSSKP